MVVRAKRGLLVEEKGSHDIPVVRRVFIVVSQTGTHAESTFGQE
jgi:hypothetical protein